MVIKAIAAVGTNGILHANPHRGRVVIDHCFRSIVEGTGASAIVAMFTMANSPSHFHR